MRGSAAVLGPVVGPVLHRTGALDPLFHLADAGEVLVELRPIGVADLPAQLGGVLLDAVEDAQRPLAPLVVEEAVEGQRRIDLHRHRRERILPGDVRAIGHREVRLVVAGDRLLAAQDQARLRRLLAEAAGEHLVHAHAPLEHRPLLERRAREDVPRLARMDADPRGLLVEQARDHVQSGLERRQGLEALAQLHVEPEPLAHQWSGLIPLPMKSAANRAGKAWAAPAAASPPHTGSDSSQGRAIATPAPRSTVRRLIRGWTDVIVVPGSLLETSVQCVETSRHRYSHSSIVHYRQRIVAAPSVEELRAGDDRLDQAAEPVFRRRRAASRIVLMVGSSEGIRLRPRA